MDFGSSNFTAPKINQFTRWIAQEIPPVGLPALPYSVLESTCHLSRPVMAFPPAIRNVVEN